METAGTDVYCTLLLSDSYLPGAAILAHSLKDAGTRKKLAVLVTLDSLLQATVDELKTLYDYVIPVDRISNPTFENLARLDRLDLRFAFTKIALWRQTRFRKIVYIDADVIALRAPEELFDLDVSFAAAPDIGWPDCFNSGVMLLKPSMSDYWSLHTLASSGTSFDGADQGLLNEYFGQRPWHRLSFVYNCTPSSSYQYEPAYRHFRSGISMVHFIGKDKPWYQGRQALSQGGSGVYKELLGRWWAVYDRHYRVPQTSAIGQIQPGLKNVSQFVRGEQTESAFGWAAAGYTGSSSDSAFVPSSAQGFSTPGFTAPRPEPIPFAASDPPFVAPPPEAPAVSTEQPFTDPGEAVENLDQGLTQPETTVQQRRFSASKSEWDATRSEPPRTSQPEAHNFPSTHYEMSQDPGLFHAPRSYPEPPKNMWYTVPEIKPATAEKPKPIFPWEETSRQPTRVFAEDLVPEPEPEVVPEVAEESAAVVESAQSPQTVTSRNVQESANDPWGAFSRTNAWDEDTSIDRYVRAFKHSQTRKGKVEVLHNTADLTSPAGVASGQSGMITPTRRRESLILTDFPSEIERPSLPVTPAPQRRPNFWGAESSAGQTEELPAAEGVPQQIDWVCPKCGYSCRLPFPSVGASSPDTDPSTSSATYTIRQSVSSTPGFSARNFPQFSTRTSVSGSSATRGGTRTSRQPSLTQPSGFFTKNPLERLDELRRSSIIATAEQLSLTSPKEIPRRTMPQSAAPIPESHWDESARRASLVNLEEHFSGERTQEKVDVGVSEMARGTGPSEDTQAVGELTRTSGGFNSSRSTETQTEVYDEVRSMDEYSIA